MWTVPTVAWAKRTALPMSLVPTTLKPGLLRKEVGEWIFL
jgi:hypothetical protein